MCEAVEFLRSGIGFLPGDVYARLLRAESVMDLLVGNVNPNIIYILFFWRSNTRFCYLHLLVEPIMKDFVAEMLNVDYTIAPLQLVPCH